MEGVFVTAQQLEDINDPLRIALDELFKGIINKELAIFDLAISETTVDEIQFVANSRGNNRSYYGGFGSTSGFTRYGYFMQAEKQEYFDDFYRLYDLEPFITKVKIFENGIRNSVTPTVRPYLLREVGLSEDQFIIRTNFEVYRHSVSISPPTPEGPRFIEFNFEFQIEFKVEDITQLAPGGIRALKTMFNNLCSDYTVQSTNELQQWAQSLNITGLDGMTKNELCDVIKNHYGWN